MTPLQLYLVEIMRRGLVKWNINSVVLESFYHAQGLDLKTHRRLEVWENFHITFNEVFAWLDKGKKGSMLMVISTTVEYHWTSLVEVVMKDLVDYFRLWKLHY